MNYRCSYPNHLSAENKEEKKRPAIVIGVCLERFEDAVQLVDDLDYHPGNSALLHLYGLFKQATVGDISTSRPGPFDLKARKKWDAWKANQGTHEDTAKAEYVAYVNNTL